MQLPVSWTWPRSVARAVRLAVTAVALVALAGHADAQASTLQHLYRFDAASVRIDAPLGSAPVVRAGFLPTTWEQGRPEIPYDVVTFLVPQGARALAVRAREVGEVVLAEEARLAFAAPIESGEGHALSPKPERGAGAGLAAAAALPGYPALRAEIAGSGALHGYELLAVRVYPVRWDPESGRLTAFERIDLEIDLAPGGQRPLERERFSPAIEAEARRLVRRLVANPEALDGYERRIGVLVDKPGGGFQPTDAPSLEGSEVDYVIITSDALAATWQTFADWKTRRGVPTVVRTVEWIQANYRRGSDVQETIRTFIKDAYAKWGVQYVLLGGDTDVIPARYGYSAFGEPTEREIPSDMYFACLDGNWNKDGDGYFGEAAVSVSDPGDSTDFYAEVYAGRVTVSTVTEVTNYVGKIQTYENPTQTTYQNKVLLLGEVLFPVEWDSGMAISMDGAAFCEEIAGFLQPCNSVTKLYENFYDYPGSLQLTLAATIAHMNTGQGFVNHIGHGYRYNMSVGDQSLVTYDALALTNADKRFVLYFLNCTATAFDYPCLAETFLKATGGAVAVLGASRAAYALPSRNYNRGFAQAAYRDSVIHLGQAFVESRLAQTPNAWFDTADHYSHLLYNFLGDPEMVMHTCNLATTVATYSGSIGLGLTNVTVHVTVGGSPRQGALVGLQKGTEEYEWGTTDAAGDVTLPFRAESAGSVQVTVSGQNMTTHLGTITVTNGGGPYVSVQSMSIDDNASGSSNGNSDGVLDASEILELAVTFTNSGNATASGLTGTLRIPSAYAAILDSTYSLANIGAGGTATSTNQVYFLVSAATPDGVVLPLTFVTTNGTSTWTDVVNKVVHAPVPRLTLLDVDDPAPGGNGDGVIQAGETFDLLAYWKNYGSGALDGLTATLSSSDPDVVITTGSVAISRINAMQETTATNRFRLRENILDENQLTIQLTDYRARSWSQAITLRGAATPATPALDASTGANIIVATWTFGSDADLAGYHVYRGLSGSGPWTRVSVDRTARIAYFRDTGLAPSTRYYYRVTAVDSSGNESSPSSSASINTNPAQLSGWPIELGSSSSCSPGVGDITGDGSKEIVAGNDHLYAWNWNGLELRDDDGDPQTWGIFANEIKTITGAVALGEMDPSSPGFEIFVTTWDDTNKAFIVRGDGSFMPNWPRNPDPTTTQKGYWADSAVMDVDGDGICEVWAPAKNGNLYAWRPDGTPFGASAAFKSGFSTYQRTSPSFANIDGDPQKEIIFGAPNGVLHIWNWDGSNYGTFPKTAATLCYGCTAIGDVNKDGVLDVVYVTEGGAVNVYNTKTGNQLSGWPKSISMKSNPKTPSPALADFDFDGYLEIVIANNANPPTASALQVYNYQGTLLPGWPINTGGWASESSPIVADVSGDGVPDVLFGNEGGLLYGFDKNGVALAGFPLTVGDWIRSVPVADDVDGDGGIDLVLTGWDKYVYIWDFSSAYNKPAAQWPMLKHDPQRSGYYKFRIDDPTDVDPGQDPPGIAAPPTHLVLEQNVPNPFNPTTRIRYAIPGQPGGPAVDVRLDIFDAGGKLVRQLVRGQETPGAHGAVWDGRDDRGRRIGSGVFFYRLQASGETQTRKMVVLK